MACDWASLPDDMLELILQKLSCVVDFLQFSAVCKSWYSASRQNKKKRQHVPMLLVPTPDQNKPNKHSLYSFAMNQIYDNIQLNIPFSKRLAGSSHGWVVIPGLYQPCKKILAVILFNPFYGKTICLPPVRSFTYEDEGNNHGDEVCDHDYIRVDGFEYRIAKVALSRDPHHYPENFELMITLSDLHSLALYKSSEKSWIYIPDHPELGMYFSDVIFYKDKFYFVNLRMGLGRIDVNRNILKDNGCDGGVSSPTPQIELVLECVYERFAEDSKNIHRNYIVETSNGDLLLVQRFLKEVEQYREHLIT
ncbi:F-box protein [Quillaja saponaria]|uniref:F-box protein n=1 Tax=Quillaja saponaria TaxID=32244 RepID=A0AAD7LVZ0_QUISA|nr:F-box protein [Quillaja saponaria]